MFVAVFHKCSKVRPSSVIYVRRAFSQTGNSDSRDNNSGVVESRPLSNIRRKMTSKSPNPKSQSKSSSTSTTVEENVDDKVLSNLFSFCSFVKLDRLTANEKLIHSKHMKALQNHQEMYEDPSTGYSVLTRLAHLKRGDCCGNACRHCPFGQKNVPVDIPKKTYNSAFFV